MLSLDPVRRHRTPIMLAAALLLMAGSWMAAGAYGAPIVSEETRRDVAWSETAAYEYSVPVTRNSTHWPEGTVLPMGLPAYFRTISDSVLVDFTWSPEGPVEGVAAARMVVEVRAHTPEGLSYWSLEHDLAEATAPRAADGLVLSARLDLDRLVDEVDKTSREQPVTQGVINWTVVTTVTYAVAVDGKPETRSQTYVLGIVADEPRYVLPPAEELTWTEEHAQTRVLRSSEPAGWPGVIRHVRSLALILLGGVLLGLAIAAGGAAGGEFDREYRRFREFVSVTAGVPPMEGATVEVETLEDLVNVASDGRTRVLLDAKSKTFYALLPGVTYRYARHASPFA